MSTLGTGNHNKTVLRWSTLAIAVVAALTLQWLSLTQALTAADMPDHASIGYHRSVIYSSISFAVAFAGLAIFLFLRSLPRVTAGTILCTFSCLLALAYPQLREFWLVDRCLDEGGRWNAATYECQK